MRAIESERRHFYPNESADALMIPLNDACGICDLSEPVCAMKIITDNNYRHEDRRENKRSIKEIRVYPV